MRRTLLVSLAVIAMGCGRSGFFDEQLDTEDHTPTTAPAPPTAIYSATLDGCATGGARDDLIPTEGERVVVARLQLVGECSGAGGDWIIGRIAEENRDVMLGHHACFFLGGVETRPSTAFGVVRINQTAALFHGPTGWCIRDADGNEPVRSDVIVRSIAVFATEADARAWASQY